MHQPVGEGVLYWSQTRTDADARRYFRPARGTPRVLDRPVACRITRPSHHPSAPAQTKRTLPVRSNPPSRAHPLANTTASPRSNSNYN
jgi:hypothetical protein